MSAVAPITGLLERVGLEKMMSRSQERVYWMFVGLWVAVNLWFWVWWPLPGHPGDLTLFVVVSVTFFYVVTVLPSAYLFFLGRMRKPVHIDVHHAERRSVVRRVAVISLTVPGAESLEIVRRQLLAIRAIRYPHDSWILVDKEHSPEIAALAADLGVNYFCRHDEQTWGAEQVERWNQPIAPFAARTKAGNVNSWLDAYSQNYSHFTQLDIDHNPVPTYLDEVLGYFSDRKIAWVQAPSVYDNREIWTARGSSEQELVLQGPLQSGFFGFSRTPFIIGSHSTYDVAAIEEIGGFQPTRAEDHLDTVCLAAHGYEGVYVPRVIARGDGPEDFATYLAQQFAWAYSMIQVLFHHTPRLIRQYTPRRALQFVFVQTWYTFWSLSMLVLFTAPIVTLTLNKPVATMSYWSFLLHMLPLSAVSTAVWYWSRTWHQPVGLRLSWRGVALHVARWVVVLSALIQVVFRVQKPYMITTKGVRDGVAPFPLRAVAPFIGLVLLPLAACWFYLTVYVGGPSQGFLLFALKTALVFWLLLMVLVWRDVLDLVRRGMTATGILRLRWLTFAVMSVLTVTFGVVTAWSVGPIITALMP